MATYPFLVSGACASVAQNVFKVRFSQPLSSVPNLRAYDNANVFPATGAGTATTYTIFQGSAGNSNKSMLYFADTTRGGPAASTWWVGAVDSGALATIRMLGDVAYLQFRYSAASMVANASLNWNALVETPADVNPTMSRLHDIVCRYSFTSTIPTVLFFANNEHAGGTEAVPVWGTITTDSQGVRFSSAAGTNTSMLANIPLAGVEITKKAWVADA